MGKWLLPLAICGSFFGGVVMLVVSIPPAEALSNFSAWADVIGLSSLAGRLASPNGYRVAILVGMSFVEVGIVLAWFAYRRRLRLKQARLIDDDQHRLASSVDASTDVECIGADISEGNIADRTHEIVFSSRILKVSVRELHGGVGPTRSALEYCWSSGESGAFDEIEGHHPRIYCHDFDGDGAQEVILRYHCGAHSEGMRIYKIIDAPQPPILIPGADLISDWPDITWRPMDAGGGVSIHVMNRNYAGSPASDPPLVDRYIFRDGECVVVPDDGKLEG